MARRAFHIADFWDPETERDRRSSAWGLAPEFQHRLLELADADSRQLKMRFGIALSRADVESKDRLDEDHD
jgi:hypothetical protein